LTEDQAKIEVVRLLLSGDSVQELFSRYLEDNDLAAYDYDMQETFHRQQLLRVRLRCVVERTKDHEDRKKFSKVENLARAYGLKNWQHVELPSMQNVMTRLRRFCRITFDSVPKLALRHQKVVVDMTIRVPPPTGVD
jgi:hypothetical protein